LKRDYPQDSLGQGSIGSLYFLNIKPEFLWTQGFEEFPMNHQTLLLSREDIQECLDMSTCLKIVEGVFKAHGEANVVMPPKLNLNLEAADMVG
jgi:hypothetical protein